MPFRREAVKPDTMMIQPAVTDAIFAGTRKRLRSLPIPGQDLRR
jgi:CO/xanthine dehydrogenase Mo-binding subunit